MPRAHMMVLCDNCQQTRSDMRVADEQNPIRSSLYIQYGFKIIFLLTFFSPRASLSLVVSHKALDKPGGFGELIPSRFCYLGHVTWPE
jgi:hypothetical protein